MQHPHAAPTPDQPCALALGPLRLRPQAIHVHCNWCTVLSIGALNGLDLTVLEPVSWFGSVGHHVQAGILASWFVLPVARAMNWLRASHVGVPVPRAIGGACGIRSSPCATCGTSPC